MINLKDVRFDFMFNRIDVGNIGHREKYNYFLTGVNARHQVALLMDDYEGYVPVGICFDETVAKPWGGRMYRPVVLENNEGDRMWIHCPYTDWKELLDLGLI